MPLTNKKPDRVSPQSLCTLTILSAALLMPCATHAGGLLEAFVDRSQRYQADYVEATFDKSGRRIYEAAGTLYLDRPNRFRCEYRSPNSNLIVGDDRNAWVYVTTGRHERITRLDNDKLLGACSAALAAGVGISQAFDLHESSLGDQGRWLVGMARSGGVTLFESVRIDFAQDDLRTVTFKNIFGQAVVIQFSGQMINPSLDEHLFHFTPPVRPE